MLMVAARVRLIRPALPLLHGIALDLAPPAGLLLPAPAQLSQLLPQGGGVLDLPARLLGLRLLPQLPAQPGVGVLLDAQPVLQPAQLDPEMRVEILQPALGGHAFALFFADILDPLPQGLQLTLEQPAPKLNGLFVLQALEK